MQFTDQLNRTISINYPPKRIVSLVPSQTELLFDLGLNDEVVGITKFCIHPKDKFKSIAKIGGTKNVDIQKIRALKPDLIIANKEENLQTDIELLMNEFPVWISDIYNLNNALNMIERLACLVDKQLEGLMLSGAIKNGFQDITSENELGNLKSVAYFIWHQPDMLAGKNTFIDEMLIYCGCKNATDVNRYPTFNEEELRLLNPELVFLSSEPYPFSNKHEDYFKRIWPNVQVELVDGEMFSWYGSRLLKSSAYFKQLKNKLFY